jgi:hypothetical protein
MTTVEMEARELKSGAEHYAREELERLERVLTDTIRTVQRGRTKLDQRLTTNGAAPTPHAASHS